MPKHRGDDREWAFRHGAAWVLGCLALLAGPPAAFAQDNLPPGSGVDQYIESLPGAGGRTVPGSGPQQPKGGQGENRYGNDRDGRLLRRLADDPALGAPSRERGEGSRAREDDAGSEAGGQRKPRRGSVTGAATDTFLGSSTGLPVLLGLLAIGATGGIAAHRRGIWSGASARRRA